MNFKPTRPKVVISFLIAFFAIYFLSWTACFGPSLCPVSPWDYIIGVFSPYGFVFLLFTAVTFGIIYVVWSLVEKGKITKQAIRRSQPRGTS